MTDSKRQAGEDAREDGPLDVPHQPEAIDPEAIDSESRLRGREDETGVEADDVATLSARREAARQHGDTFLVASDLEDADQREAAPGTREQD